MPRQRRDRTTGLPLPSPVVPATNICVKIQIPNAPEYRQAFRGVLSELGNYWMWQQTEGESNQPALQAAQIWRDALSTLEYLIDCGDDMTCADVANCIETNPTTRAAVQALVPSTPQNGLLYPPTVPLSPSQMNSRLNPIDECSNDAFWAQCQQWVDFLVDLGQDVLEKLELYSNAIEAGDNVPMGQFLGKLKNGSTAGKVLEFLEWALEVVKEAYEAENTLANRQDLQCALFCEMKDDCLISIDGTLSVINQRLGGFLTPSELDDLPSLVDAFITLGSNPSTMLDLWILFLMGTAKTAGMFGLEGIDETINLVLALAVNDANNDWELLCEDCPPETRQPVMNSLWDPINKVGSISGPDEEGFYTATSVSRGTDSAFYIMDIEGRNFRLSEITYSLVPACQVFSFGGSFIYFGCNGLDNYGGQVIDEFDATWGAAVGIQTMRFKMIP